MGYGCCCCRWMISVKLFWYEHQAVFIRLLKMVFRACSGNWLWFGRWWVKAGSCDIWQVRATPWELDERWEPAVCVLSVLHVCQHDRAQSLATVRRQRMMLFNVVTHKAYILIACCVMCCREYVLRSRRWSAATYVCEKHCGHWKLSRELKFKMINKFLCRICACSSSSGKRRQLRKLSQEFLILFVLESDVDYYL